MDNLQNQRFTETTWGEVKQYFSEQYGDETPLKAKVFPVTKADPLAPKEEMEVFTFSRVRPSNEREGK